MAWYTDRKKVNYTQTYSDKAAAAEDAQKAAEYGWEVDQESSAQGSMNDATWVAGGPMGQFFGGNHQRGEVVVTFVRNENWSGKETN
jgi:hypothetical protein